MTRGSVRGTTLVVLSALLTACGVRYVTPTLQPPGPVPLGKGEPLAGTAKANSLFRGIPQSGPTLGDPGAPVTMIEYADLQCPFCGAYTRDTLPTLVKRYVRTGKVRMELRPITILGPDSGTAHAAAARSRASRSARRRFFWSTRLLMIWFCISQRLWRT